MLGNLIAIAAITLPTAFALEWEGIPSPTTVHLNGAAFATSHVGIAVGNQGKILRTADGGQTWTLVASPTNQHLQAVYFKNPTEGFIVSRGQGLNGGAIFRTVNQGFTWQQVHQATGHSFFDIHFTENGNRGFAVGRFSPTSVCTSQYGLCHVKIVRTLNGGSNWEDVYGLYLAQHPVAFGVRLLSPSLIYLVGAQNLMMFNPFGGEHQGNDEEQGWSIVNPEPHFPPNARYTDLELNSRRFLFATFATGQTGGVRISKDQGKKWKTLTRTPFPPSSIYVHNRRIIVAGAGVVSTNDFGESWKQFPSIFVSLRHLAPTPNHEWLYGLGPNGVILRARLD